jgi:hypothetical protein
VVWEKRVKKGSFLGHFGGCMGVYLMFLGFRHFRGHFRGKKGVKKGGPRGGGRGGSILDVKTRPGRLPSLCTFWPKVENSTANIRGYFRKRSKLRNVKFGVFGGFTSKNEGGGCEGGCVTLDMTLLEPNFYSIISSYRQFNYQYDETMPQKS